MGANTYPDPRVSRFINEHSVPVQFNIKEDVGAPFRYHAQWTPAIMWYDFEGNEYRRSFGSLNPDQFLAEFALAHALRFYHGGQFDRSVELFEQAQEYTKYDPVRHAENLYWIAAAKYESSTGTADDLMAGWRKLQEAYPDSDWAKRSLQLKFE